MFLTVKGATQVMENLTNIPDQVLFTSTENLSSSLSDDCDSTMFNSDDDALALAALCLIHKRKLRSRKRYI